MTIGCVFSPGKGETEVNDNEVAKQLLLGTSLMQLGCFLMLLPFILIFVGIAILFILAALSSM